MSQKNRTLNIAHNFLKYQPIFKTLSIIDSAINLQQTHVYTFHHSLNMSLHYLVKYECHEKWWHELIRIDGSVIGIVINDKSQGNVAKLLSWDGSLHCKFCLLVKEFLKWANIWRSYRQNG